MKYISFTLFAILFYASNMLASVPAATLTGHDCRDGIFAAENLSVDEEVLALEKVNLDILSLKSEYGWLYELLMPKDFWTGEYRQRGEESFWPHFKDTLKFFPDPVEIDNKNLPKALPQEITGKITYAGFFPKKYQYDLFWDSNGVTIEVRVHLKNASDDDNTKFTRLMAEAEDYWNSYLVGFGFDYSFRFKLVQSKRESHFSVRLKDNTRGPYDTEWSRGWIGSTVAHELGHMMGLGDEYQTLSGKMDCLYVSLMCNSYSGFPMKHNYYHILRRLIETQN